MTTSMNERTQFFIKIYLSHFILEKVHVGCVWEVSWRRGQTATYWLKAALLSYSGCAAQSWVTEGPSPLSGAGSHTTGFLSPTGTDSSRLWHLVKFLFDVHLLPVCVSICHHHRIQPRPQVNVIFRYLRPDVPVSLFFRLFTLAHLLIDGLVKGQYVTLICLYTSNYCF